MILRLAALLLFLAAAADAAPVVVEGRTVELPVPSGYCPIDRERAPDARLWDAMRGLQEQDRNHLLAWFAACNDLDRWRGDPDSPLERHAMVLARMGMPDYSRHAVVEEMARSFEGSRGVIGEGPIRMQLLETRDDAVLAMMTQDVPGATGPRRIVAVITFTSLHHAPVTTNFYAPDGPEALQPTREAALGYLANLVAANPEPRSRLAWLAAAGVLAAALAGGALWWWRRRPRRAA